MVPYRLDKLSYQEFFYGKVTSHCNHWLTVDDFSQMVRKSKIVYSLDLNAHGLALQVVVLI